MSNKSIFLVIIGIVTMLVEFAYFMYYFIGEVQP